MLNLKIKQVVANLFYDSWAKPAVLGPCGRSFCPSLHGFVRADHPVGTDWAKWVLHGVIFYCRLTDFPTWFRIDETLA